MQFVSIHYLSRERRGGMGLGEKAEVRALLSS